MVWQQWLFVVVAVLSFALAVLFDKGRRDDKSDRESRDEHGTTSFPSFGELFAGFLSIVSLAMMLICVAAAATMQMKKEFGLTVLHGSAWVCACAVAIVIVVVGAMAIRDKKAKRPGDPQEASD